MLTAIHMILGDSPPSLKGVLATYDSIELRTVVWKEQDFGVQRKLQIHAKETAKSGPRDVLMMVDVSTG